MRFSFSANSPADWWGFFTNSANNVCEAAVWLTLPSSTKLISSPSSSGRIGNPSAVTPSSFRADFTGPITQFETALKFDTKPQTTSKYRTTYGDSVNTWASYAGSL